MSPETDCSRTSPVVISAMCWSPETLCAVTGPSARRTSRSPETRFATSSPATLITRMSPEAVFTAQSPPTLPASDIAARGADFQVAPTSSNPMSPEPVFAMAEETSP